ncbi:MAG TPA: 3-methyl-2-oxobutanoate hydroxymethyltransferase [Gemmatimonadaceae bacterium]|jgi:3-methyl-2-oxobutanoate hydroxymethyltransferase|nr:3-methyl-2-oxobutanoate hydroxymethyltransferase [Gemmatimonadaceae bacterium]
MSSASGPGRVKPVTVRDFIARKVNGEKLVVVTAYDALFGRLVDESGVDAVLVGDSLGNVVAGLDSTLPVTLDQMIYHARMARRGVERALLIVDMPFLTYQVGTERALLNCGRVMQETEAQALKLEGATPAILDVVRAVTSIGIPVMGHLGFTPQSVHALGGYRVQGREGAAAERLVEDARSLEEAGAFSIVLELMPAAVAARVTEAVSIPTIGIGAGVGCDGQVLVLPDLLGLNDRFAPKFLKRYASLADEVRSAVGKFGEDVRNRRYPDDEHSF